MPSLFISHSSHDRSAAEGISERLRAQGFGALFLDFDPQQGIPAGRSWERELYAQLRRNDAVVSSWLMLPIDPGKQRINLQGSSPGIHQP